MIQVCKNSHLQLKNIEGSVNNTTWKIVFICEIPNDANILKETFVLVVTEPSLKREIYKALSVVQEHQDFAKTSLIHDIYVARQQSTRMFVGLAAIFGFRIFFTDVSQAYLHSLEALNRDIVVNPCKGFELNYNLSKSGDYWSRILQNHLLKDIRMDVCISDRAMF